MSLWGLSKKYSIFSLLLWLQVCYKQINKIYHGVNPKFNSLTNNSFKKRIHGISKANSKSINENYQTLGTVDVPVPLLYPRITHPIFLIWFKLFSPEKTHERLHKMGWDNLKVTYIYFTLNVFSIRTHWETVLQKNQGRYRYKTLNILLGHNVRYILGQLDLTEPLYNFKPKIVLSSVFNI